MLVVVALLSFKQHFDIAVRFFFLVKAIALTISFNF
jgi:hypothetical protein